MLPNPYRLMIDEILSTHARVENDAGHTFVLPRSQLPSDAREQDWLRREPAGYVVDTDYTAQRRQENLSLYQSLLKKPPAPDKDK